MDVVAAPAMDATTAAGRCRSGGLELGSTRRSAKLSEEGSGVSAWLEVRWRLGYGSGVAQAQEWPARRGSEEVVLRCCEVGQ
jgi:hypothetical protein